MEPAARPQFDLARSGDALFRTRAAQIGWFLLLALVSRVSVFGDSNYFPDEYFYFQAGLRLHDGALPYVDVWDRKGPGLFFTYWLITCFGRGVIAYQAAALLFAAATAYCVNLIAERFATRIGAMLGGSLYLVALVLFGGGGGQSPVFYNLATALAALGVVRALPALQTGHVPAWLYAAMASAGFAITFKQTAVCEALFLGGFVLWQLWRAGTPLLRIVRIASALAAAGIAPMALFAAFYAAAGHFGEFWHAMVTANLLKAYNPAGDHWRRLAVLTMLFSPVLLPAIAGALIREREHAAPRGFLAGWLLAGIAGFVIIPNFYEHYLLPLCLPACVAAARALGHRAIGPVYGYAAVLFLLLLGPGLDFSRREASRQAMAALTRDILARDPHPRPLVYEGPVDLYRQLGAYPPSPLYYPLHLYFPPEHNVSHLDTGGEMRRILAWRPSVVVTFHAYPDYEENQTTARLVHGYTASHCTLWFTRRLYEVYASHLVDVWGCPSAPQLTQRHPPRR